MVDNAISYLTPAKVPCDHDVRYINLTLRLVKGLIVGTCTTDLFTCPIDAELSDRGRLSVKVMPMKRVEQTVSVAAPPYLFHPDDFAHTSSTVAVGIV